MKRSETTSNDLKQNETILKPSAVSAMQRFINIRSSFTGLSKTMISLCLIFEKPFVRLYGHHCSSMFSLAFSLIINTRLIHGISKGDRGILGPISNLFTSTLSPGINVFSIEEQGMAYISKTNNLRAIEKARMDRIRRKCSSNNYIIIRTTIFVAQQKIFQTFIESVVKGVME